MIRLKPQRKNIDRAMGPFVPRPECGSSISTSGRNHHIFLPTPPTGRDQPYPVNKLFTLTTTGARRCERTNSPGTVTCENILQRHGKMGRRFPCFLWSCSAVAPDTAGGESLACVVVYRGLQAVDRVVVRARGRGARGPADAASGKRPCMRCGG